jgi:putative acetyltransferase
MTEPINWRIRPFIPTDQQAAKQLILEGLAEHWGALDLSLNSDLNDIASSYTAVGHLFVVVEEDGALIGTGALVAEGADVGRIVRVSVSTAHRRRGLGRAITEYLVEEGRRRGYGELLVETTDAWHDAIRLYQACGFVPFAHRDGDVHLRCLLSAR